MWDKTSGHNLKHKRMKKWNHRLVSRMGAFLMAAAMVLTLAMPTGLLTASAATASATATVPINQTVVNGGTGTTFHYTMTPETNSAGAPMPEGTNNGTYSFSLTGNQSSSIKVSSSTPGTWYYTLTAVDANSSSYTYNVKTYRIGVKIYNDNGELKAEINAKATDPASDYKARAVNFTITYPSTPTPTPNPPTPNPPTPTPSTHTATVNPTVVKQISGDTPSSDTTFQFTLEAADDVSKAYLPATDGTKTDDSVTVIREGAGEKSFGMITFDKAGEYKYDVTEVKGNSTGYTYDDSTYRITYVVTENENVLTATATVSGENNVINNTDTVTFTNTYTAPAEPNKQGVGDPTITKQINSTSKDNEGNAINPTTAQEFHFTLEPYNSEDKATYPMPSGAENGTLSVTTTGQGQAEFGDIVFTEPGTYYYKITEQKETVEGYTYDETIYRIQYVVSDNGGSSYDVERTMYKVNGDDYDLVQQGSDDVTFTNEYKVREESGGSTDTSKNTKKSSGTTTTKTNTITRNRTNYINNNTENNTTNTTTKSVKTGDPTPIVLYMAMLGGAAAVIIILGVMRRKKREEENQ